MHSSIRRLLRNAALMAVVTFAMAVVLQRYANSTGPLPGAHSTVTPAVSSSDSSGSGWQDGTYTSAAEGYLSDVEVTVVIENGAISAVTVDASGETPALGGEAAEVLLMAILTNGGTAGVEAVSGATFTSNAVLAAAEVCLEQAAG